MNKAVLTIASLGVIAAVGLSACTTMGEAPSAIAAPANSAIAAAVADTMRPAADIARDDVRKPAQIVSFAGVEPGDVVAEIAPGGGYYTRILSRSVGPQGRVFALMPVFAANRPGGLDAINALAAQYGNVEVVVVDYAQTRLPEPVDLVWTTENYHDLANGDIGQVNGWVFDALKPGGLFFVEDHSAPGTGTSATSTLHRIDPAAVRQQVTSAGFVLDAESDLLRNSSDPHDVSPRDIQPTSDKFALRFKKPQ